jgi:hypothetical protein
MAYIGKRFGNLPAYSDAPWLSPEQIAASGGDVGAALFTADVLEPASASNNGLWIILAVILGLLILPGKKSDGPVKNPPFYSRKHPVKVKGYYARQYFRRKANR